MNKTKPIAINIKDISPNMTGDLFTILCGIYDIPWRVRYIEINSFKKLQRGGNILFFEHEDDAINVADITSNDIMYYDIFDHNILNNGNPLIELFIVDGKKITEDKLYGLIHKLVGLRAFL